jgi:hypothetical protein
MATKATHQKALLAAREMCDGLLGVHRNSPLDAVKKESKLEFYDPRVCKYALCGPCPHALFLNTKTRIGPCPFEICGRETVKLTSAVRDWDALPQGKKDEYGYEFDTLSLVSRLVRQNDDKKAKQQKRLEAEETTGATLGELNERDQQKLIEIANAMQEKSKLAQRYGEDEKVDEVMAVMKEIDELDKQRKSIVQGGANTSKLSDVVNKQDSKLIVCEVTGQYLCSQDGEDRMTLYFAGKQYRGWKAVRDLAAILKAKNPPRGTIRRSSNNRRGNDGFRDRGGNRRDGYGRHGDQGGYRGGNNRQRYDNRGRRHGDEGGYRGRDDRHRRDNHGGRDQYRGGREENRNYVDHRRGRQQSSGNNYRPRHQDNFRSRSPQQQRHQSGGSSYGGRGGGRY